MLIKEYKGKSLHSPADAAEILRKMLGAVDPIGQDREHFWCIGLDTKNKVKYTELVAVGSLDACIIHARELFRNAVHFGAKSLILGHNHPSGDLTPSNNDHETTEKMLAAGRVLNIPVMDHIIIGGAEGRDYYSFNSMGFCGPVGPRKGENQ
jgi:DNA repair protein RadC